MSFEYFDISLDTYDEELYYYILGHVMKYGYIRINNSIIYNANKTDVLLTRLKTVYDVIYYRDHVLIQSKNRKKEKNIFDFMGK